jgi:hypothetical protein
MENSMNHPTDLTLIAYAEGDEIADYERVAAHVAHCLECQAASRELLALMPAAPAQPFSFSAPLLEALESVIPEPAAGQLWRCAWEGTVQLVYLLSYDSDPGTVAAAPLVELADSSGDVFVLDKDVLGWQGAVQLSLTTVLPIRVLDMFLGDAADRTENVLKPEVMSPLDPRAAELAAVQDDMNLLATANWVPVGDEDPLDVILQRMWTAPTQMAADTGIEASICRSLLGGRHVPDESERSKLAAAGVPANVIGPPPVAPLLRVLDEPQTRPLWRQDAARRGTVDSASYRWQQYTDNRFALAARSTGRDTSEESVWRDRVAEILSGGS